eukprot:8224494-Pyramimonas_sp.AAC.1
MTTEAPRNEDKAQADAPHTVAAAAPPTPRRLPPAGEVVAKLWQVEMQTPPFREVPEEDILHGV